jgi:predicted acylesterase/phospholipase RssA
MAALHFPRSCAWNVGSLALLLLMTAILGACAHPRPKQPSPIAIPSYPMSATDHPSYLAPIAARSRIGKLRYDERLQPRPIQCQSPQLAAAITPLAGPARYLVLSGGSQNGAFGAGFFLGLQEAGLIPPEPTIVTGISTGALQSTFLFLARQPVPSDRNYDWVGGIATRPPDNPQTDRPALVPRRSSIEDLALAYSIRREPDILKSVTFGGLGMLVNGTKGTLDPLRRRLLALVSPQTIRTVAIEACRGRKLLVGAANVDDGQAYAFDMTALALMAFDGNATPTRMTDVRKAYVEALLASSSVPVGAKPVTLRIRDMENNLHRRNLFVDGGARFGVFLEDIEQARLSEGASDAGHDGVTLIVNTRLTMGPWHNENPLYPKKGWLMTTLGLRTVKILENQVYRLSVEAVEHKAKQLAGLHMAYISKENITGGDEPDAHTYRGKSCMTWRDEDDRALDPIEFYPHYMACLIDYGRVRGRANQWNLVR